MRTRILDATVEFRHQPFVHPLRISSGLITEITEARTAVRVNVCGREAVGRGSIYLSDLWAWPDLRLTHFDRDLHLRELCRRIAANLWELCGSEPEHPLELGLRLHESVCRKLESPVGSLLARAMCASPFDAAVHDAVGIALGRSSFSFYEEPMPIPSGDHLFRGKSACRAIARMLRSPVRKFDAWLVVSKDDSLESDVAPWVRKRGYRCFKIKILGQDTEADVVRTADVYSAVKSWGVRNPRIVVDSNEANPDSASVLHYLDRLQVAREDAYNALEYLEQPTGRDITFYRNDWRMVTARKPVMLDEGLTGFEVLEEALAQGWSGIALKTCKGHSFALTSAAWAVENGMLLSLQDLTNPGLSMIHAALFAAYVPTINGVELNSPQYTPAANAEWLPRLSCLFEPMDGIHRLPDEIPPGLGSVL